MTKSIISPVFLILLIGLLLCTISFATIIDSSNINEFFANGMKLPTPTLSSTTTPLSDDEQLYQDLFNPITNYNNDLVGQNDVNGPTDLNFMRQRAAYSSIARCLQQNLPSVSKWTCTWCNDGKVPKLVDVSAGIVGDSKLGYYVGYDATTDDERFVLVFKSSSSLENWLLNFDASLADMGTCTNCKAHKGFFLGWKNQLKTTVLNALSALQTKYPKCKKTSISGHSLGGAMTTLAAIDLHNGVFVPIDFFGIKYWHNIAFESQFNEMSHDEFVSLYAIANNQDELTVKNSLFSNAKTFRLEFPLWNFGSPRVFNEQGAAWFNAQIPRKDFRRVSHLNDLVTHVPPISLKYHHVGQERYYYEKELSPNYKECSLTDSEDKTCSYSNIPIDIKAHQWYQYSMLQNDIDCK